MPKRKIHSLKAKKRAAPKATKKASPRRSVAHYTAILIEDLKSEFRVVTEQVQGLKETFEQKMAEGFRDVHARLDIHERYLIENTERWIADDKRWGDNEAWQREAMRLLSSIDERIGHHDEKLDDHDERITAVERRLPAPC